jgi:hypothetical protein
MAQAAIVARTAEASARPLPMGSAERIDREFARLENEWAGIPELAAEWPEWDAHSRFSFAIDWPICEDILGRLLDREERGVLNPARQARLASLKALIAQHRPTLERLLAES